jgi:hypothetical protein
MLFGEFLVLLGILSGSGLGFAYIIARYKLRQKRQKKWFDDLSAALASQKYQSIDDLMIMHPDMDKTARRYLEARRDQLFIEQTP